MGAKGNMNNQTNRAVNASVRDERFLLSVVSPVFNEEQGIEAFYSELRSALVGIADMEYEIIFVDDGSQDDSYGILKELGANDPGVRVLRLSRNFGHQVAITCGVDHAKGDAVVIIDSDLQDPPEVIPEMVRAWRDGADVAYGQRRERSGESRFKLATAKGFYRFIQRLSDTEIPPDVGDFRLLSRPVVDVLKQMREEDRYVRGLVAWAGFTQVPVMYDRNPRIAGASNYPLKSMMKLALDGVTSFSDKPLKIATGLGLMVSAAAALLAVYIVVSKLLNPSASVPGFATLSALILFMGGAQLVSLGVIGEYVGRIFRESKSRPLYVVMDDSKR